MGSGRRKAEWTRDAWRESGVGGSGERAEGTDARIPMLCHSQYCRSHFLRQSTSLQVALAWVETIAPPAGITLPYLVELKPGCLVQLDAISVISLTTKADLWELWHFIWPSSGPDAGKSWPYQLFKSSLCCRSLLFITLNISCHSLLVWNISVGKSDASLIGAPL